MNFIDSFQSGDTFFWTIVLLTFILTALVLFLYLRNLQGLLTAIREPNRAMAPNGVWLVATSLVNNILSIPLYYLSYDSAVATIVKVLSYMVLVFVVVWHYKVVQAVASSIEAEYDSRNIPIEHKPTLQTGMFMVGAQALVLLREIPYIGVIGGFAAIAYIVAFILYWVRTWKFKKEIVAMSANQDEDSLIFKDLL